MRNRLLAAFVTLTLLVAVAAGVARAVALRAHVEEQQAVRLDQVAVLALGLVEQRRQTGRAVDREFLEQIVPPTARLAYTAPGRRTVVVTGEQYVGSDGDLLTDRARGDAGRVAVSEPALTLSDVLADEKSALMTLVALLLLGAGVAGGIAARLISRPFRRLAVAAEALSGGRFDVVPPRSHIAEARLIGDAIRVSAMRLEKRFVAQHPFTERTSHVLRTPLTGMRLELEDLLSRDGVAQDVRVTAARCLSAVERMDAHVGEVMAATRAVVALEDVEVPLPRVARSLAQRWADRLGRRRFTGLIDGDLDITVAPGPVEQLLDLVLDHVRSRGRGPVTMAIEAEHGCLRIRIESDWRDPGRPPRAGDSLAEARRLAVLLGGRIRESGPAQDLEILLPVR